MKPTHKKNVQEFFQKILVMPRDHFWKKKKRITKKKHLRFTSSPSSPLISGMFLPPSPPPQKKKFTTTTTRLAFFFFFLKLSEESFLLFSSFCPGKNVNLFLGQRRDGESIPFLSSLSSPKKKSAPSTIRKYVQSHQSCLMSKIKAERDQIWKKKKMEINCQLGCLLDRSGQEDIFFLLNSFEEKSKMNQKILIAEGADQRIFFFTSLPNQYWYH